VRSDETRLQDIPRSRTIISMIYPHHDTGLKDFPHPSAQAASGMLVFCVSVVRVRPRTYRSITDLLLALVSIQLRVV
jgi:hypothetical protein